MPCELPLTRQDRVVVPAAIRDRLSLIAGHRARDYRGRHRHPSGAGGARAATRQNWPPSRGASDRTGRLTARRRHRCARRGRAQPVAVGVFLDTSVLLAGLIDFGPQSAPAQSLMHAVSEKTIAGPATGLALLPRVFLGFDPLASGIPPVDRRCGTPAERRSVRADGGPRSPVWRSSGPPPGRGPRQYLRRPDLRCAHRGSRESGRCRRRS